MKKLNLFINKVLHLFEVRTGPINGKVVYLTFDDGPEPDITEFVLEELRKYGAKATFFCRGDNAEKHSNLLSKISAEGHALGNHTYSYINSFNTVTHDYVADIERADSILKSHLFRPPWGSITLPAFIRLRRKYKIVYWNLLSGDTDLDRFDKQFNINRLQTATKTGDVVLLHCCERHAKETRQILPDYLCWLHNNGFRMDILK